MAAGETRQPGGSNVMELQWDEELARVAQARADSCVFQHECSDCRRGQRFKADFHTSHHWGPAGHTTNYKTKHCASQLY